MEAVVHDMLAYYQKALVDGDNEGQRFLERNNLLDANLIENTKLGFATGKLYDILGTHQKSSLSKLGLINRQTEHFKNCLVMPVYNLQGALIDLYGLRLRSTDVRAILWRNSGIIGSECLKHYSEILFCEYPLYWLHCRKEGFKNAVAARSEAEAVSLIRVLRNHGVTKVHYLGRKYRKTIIPLLEAENIKVDCLPVTPHGAGIDLETLRKLDPPKVKTEINLFKDTESHLYFRAGEIDFRVERGVVITPAKKAQVKAERENRQYLDRVDFTTAKSRSRFARLASNRLQIPANQIEEHLADIADHLDKLHLERMETPESEIELSPAAESEAKQILEKENLLNWCSNIMEKSLGYAGGACSTSILR